MREHRPPLRLVVASLALALLTSSCGGAPAAATGSAASTAPSNAASSSTPPSAVGTVSEAGSTAQTPGPKREMPSIKEVIGAAELVDPTGDVSWRPETEDATQPPGTPNIDVSRIVGWIAGEILYAEVTLEGQMPTAPAQNPALRLVVRAGQRTVEAPIICRPLCEEWGSWIDKPAFTYRVKQLPSQWVATFAIDLSSIGAADSTTYRIDVSAEAYPADYLSDWYDETGPLVVRQSP